MRNITSQCNKKKQESKDSMKTKPHIEESNDLERRVRRSRFEPKTDRLKAQSAEITALLQDNNITPERMAKACGIRVESLVKFVRGTMPASDLLMQSIRNAAFIEQLKKGSPIAVATGSADQRREWMSMLEEAGQYALASQALVEKTIKQLKG
jgi:hypothetical protein